MVNRLLHGLVAISVLAPPTAAQTLTIDHQPAGCVTVDKFPRLEARFSPPESVAIARVVFQGQTADWYSVTMKPDGAAFAGVLPKPKKDLKSFRYYIDVTDKAMGTSRTAEFTTSVVDSSGACKGKLMAGALSTASVILQGPAGVVALPAGFASTGVVAGSAAGSGAAAGAAGASAAGGGGGLGATALVLGGVVVAGGAAAAVVAKGGEGDSSSDSSSGSGGQGSTSTLYDLSFVPSLPGIDVSVCSNTSTTFGGFPITATASGTFDFVASQLTPVLRVVGQVTASSFQATLACTNGARTGSITASGSNGNYTGTFSFGPSTGQVSITRR